jgi:hypothetical protein
MDMLATYHSDGLTRYVYVLIIPEFSLSSNDD